MGFMRRDDIEKALLLVSEFIQNCGEPSNEANTCHHVIVPLLHGMGYTNFDLSSQESNGAGQFPDYTVLPRTSHTWYLEAKTWSATLKDNDMHQAINYAHSEGRRWVVLSNGREWRLYDDQIQNVGNADRLVARASINDQTEFVDLLAALSKESIQSGDISRSVVATKLRSVIEPQLVDASSDVNKKLAQLLKQSPGMHDIKSADVANYFRQRQMAPQIMDYKFKMRNAQPAGLGDKPAIRPNGNDKCRADLLGQS
jgi:predicted type IV restriction endonuclease